MKYTFIALAFMIAASLIPAPPAHGIDTSSSLLCSVIKAAECSLEEECVDGSSNSFDIPQFIKFDFQKKTISEVGETGKKRQSKIINLVESENQLVMQGVENNRGWSAIIGDQGKMTATVSGSDFGIVVFGACLRQ